MTAWRRGAAVVCALGIAVGAAACGGDDTVVVTVTTDELPGTPPATATDTPTTLADPTTAAPTTVSAPPTTPTDPGSADIADRLPAVGAMPGTSPGTPVSMSTALEMTTALYADGDPARITAAQDLDAAGFRTGVLRDDQGTDNTTGVALFRSYVMEVGSPEAARAEVVRGLMEVRQSSTIEMSSVPVPGIPGAGAVTGEGTQQGTRLAVLFISFPVDRYIYGLQAVARRGDLLFWDRMVAIAGEQAAAG